MLIPIGVGKCYPDTRTKPAKSPRREIHQDVDRRTAEPVPPGKVDRPQRFNSQQVNAMNLGKRTLSRRHQASRRKCPVHFMRRGWKPQDHFHRGNRPHFIQPGHRHRRGYILGTQLGTILSRTTGGTFTRSGRLFIPVRGIRPATPGYRDACISPTIRSSHHIAATKRVKQPHRNRKNDQIAKHKKSSLPKECPEVKAEP